MDVLLRVDKDGDVSASVVGTMTCAFVAPSAAVTGFAGIRFRPGEALAFLDVAAGDACDALLTPLDAGLTIISRNRHKHRNSQREVRKSRKS
jgi:hypothetical protein